MDTITSETLRLSMLKDKDAAYVFDKRRLEENIKNMRRAFMSRYNNFEIAYSFKTNYLRDIIETVRDLGCKAEVVSPYEFTYARRLGFAEDHIVYNGVIPDTVAKTRTAKRGGYVNVDNLNEYREISKEAQIRGIRIGIGVRVNFGISNGLVSRFGVDVESEEFETLMEELANDKRILFAGFHCHIGTARQLDYWAEKIEKMTELANKYKASYIDLGGGMFGAMPEELSEQFNGYVSSFDEYAESICGIMKKAFPDESVKLIVEPGTALVGNTMSVIAKVVNIKNVRGHDMITVNCNSNAIGMLCECRDIPVIVHKADRCRKAVEVKDATISGNTCLEFDYLKKGFSGDISVGDVLEFANCGAYSIGAARQFIVPRLRVIDTDGNTIRNAENYWDMFVKYELSEFMFD